jgi:hypothetical protein
MPDQSELDPAVVEAFRVRAPAELQRLSEG